MRSTFSGFEAARKGLLAQQRALDVTSHNIANANTPGYTRQRAEMTTTTPYKIPGFNGQIGTGVEVSAVRRLRDDFTDYQFRSENQSLGNWEAQAETLERVEGIFAEPNSAGLKKVIGEFFNAWQDLSRDGGSDTVRALVRERGVAVSQMFNHIYSQLEDTRTDLNEGIQLTVKDVNNTADQIAALNQQIYNSELTGDVANDLRDRRDSLVDNLSKLVNVRVYEENGNYSIMVGGMPIVNHTSVVHMRADKDTNGLDQVTWDDAGKPGASVNLTGGKLAGQISVRDNGVVKYMTELDKVAAGFAQAVNDQHRQGFSALKPDADPTVAADWATNEDFFTVDPANPAKLLKVTNAIMDTSTGLRHILAASQKVASDGGNALALAQVRQDTTPGGLTDTVENSYASLLGTLGVDSEQAHRLSDNQANLVEQIQLRRESVSAVSLDEEMTSMIKFQHAYNAAARVTTVMDEVLDTLINRMGMR